MSDTTTRYVPRDYRRVCDICGLLYNVSSLHRQGEYWVCSVACANERTRDELARGNARQRPFQVRPVPHPKPLDPNYPNTFAADEGALLTMLDAIGPSGSQYIQVDSGSARIASALSYDFVGWASRYLYDLIVANARSADIVSHETRLLVQSMANSLIVPKVRGIGNTATSTQANDAFYGGCPSQAAAQYVAEDQANAGICLLNAYRINGALVFLRAARAVASFLRNMQAIGGHGTNFTSSDAAGTVRLDSGAVTSYVSTLAGFFADHRFYPSSLVVLEFWNLLLSIDGDQTIGATTAVTGFDTIPAQTLSASIAQLRAFWLTGVQDSAGQTFTGLSAATPRELFNAYPATKPNTSPAVTGTGRWEFQDGGATTGTLVTVANFAKGLFALTRFEGLSTQVTSVSDWLRGFTSNAAFETPANTQPGALARAQTGTFDATIAPPTLLLVRDSANSFAAIAKNGSSLYDWGAFGLLAPVWAVRNAASWKMSRLAALGVSARYADGRPSDGLSFDRIALRGRSGLSFQTAFQETILGAPRAVEDGSAACQYGMGYRL